MLTKPGYMKNLEHKIFDIENFEQFQELAFEIFHIQAEKCAVYQSYLKNLKINPQKIKTLSQIPFLPIEFFKTHEIKTSRFNEEIVFYSSGTTSINRSKHFIKNLNLYNNSFIKAFELFYANIKNYCILALLPSYLEQKGSSLVFMVNNLIKESYHPDSGFFLYNYQKLADKLIILERQKQKTLLIGVSFALLEFVEKFNLNLKHTIIMETGGMKGRRKEIIRDDLHTYLCDKLGVENIHSEYGMTELLSQAYSPGKGIFKSPPWMKILIRAVYDPFKMLPDNKSGGINIIDLANIYSCSFIETKDLGKTFTDNTFTISGRYDNSDIRGCNLMIN